MEFSEVPFQCLIMSQALSGPVPNIFQQFGWWDKLEDPVSSLSLEKVKDSQSLYFLESPKCWREPTPKSTVMQVPALSSEIVVNVQVVVLNIRKFPTLERMQWKTPPRQNREAEGTNYILLTGRHKRLQLWPANSFERRRGLENTILTSIPDLQDSQFQQVFLN